MANTKKNANEKIKNSTEKIENNIKKIAKQPSIRRKISRDMEVVIMNNTNGGFIYKDNKTQNRYEMSEYGDCEYITIDELLRMKNVHKTILTNFWIRIVDTEAEDVELDDVLKYLGLDKLYENVLSIEEVDELLLKYSDTKFSKVFSKLNKEFKNRIIERSIILFNEKTFDNFTKMKLIEEYLKNDSFYDEIAERNKENK